MSDNNMLLWDHVSKTNPKYTKKVKFGREFTAIDPHSQVMEATRAFGPVGKGWGWTVGDPVFMPTNEVAILITLWVEGHTGTYSQWGQNGLYIDKADTKKDGDCMKKATTDGLTKCLSYLGFNADIFLGKFDDNKYVQAVTVEFNKKEEEESWTSELEDKLDKGINTLEKSKTLKELAENFAKVKPLYSVIRTASVDKAGVLNNKYTELATKLKGNQNG